jgi:putative transposase
VLRQREPLRAGAPAAAEPRATTSSRTNGTQRKLRMPVVIDELTRESSAIDAAFSFTVQRVIEVLRYLFAVRGAPQHLRSDNGPEFVAQAVTRWVGRADVTTLFIARGSPWEIG